jgi:hypothetical protein
VANDDVSHGLRSLGVGQGFAPVAPLEGLGIGVGCGAEWQQPPEKECLGAANSAIAPDKSSLFLKRKRKNTPKSNYINKCFYYYNKNIPFKY